MKNPIPKFKVGDRVVNKRTKKISTITDCQLIPSGLMPLIRVANNKVENDITTCASPWIYQCDDDTSNAYGEELLSLIEERKEYRLFLVPNSPWEEILHLFPKGFPVAAPFPNASFQNSEIMLWAIEFNLLTQEQKEAIATILSKQYDMLPHEILREAENTGCFAIASNWGERLEGDDKNIPMAERLVMGRHFLVIRKLKQQTIAIDLDIQMGLVLLNFLKSSKQIPTTTAEATKLANKVVDLIGRAVEQLSLSLKDLSKEKADFYSKKFFELVKNETNIVLELKGDEVFILFGQLQLYKRFSTSENSPEINEYLNSILIELHQTLASVCPEAAGILEQAWHPEFDL